MAALDLGFSEEEYQEAEGLASEGFKPLDSGNYKATVKEVILFEGKFGQVMIHKVELNDSKKVLTFKSNIGKTLKDGGINPGWINRVKMFAHATGVDKSDLSLGAETKVKEFGQEYTGNFILGMNDKPLIASIGLYQDTNREGEQYEFSNHIHGVLAMDKTNTAGEDGVSIFKEMIADKPTFKFAGYKKDSAKKASSSNETADVDDDDL